MLRQTYTENILKDRLHSLSQRPYPFSGRREEQEERRMDPNAKDINITIHYMPSSREQSPVILRDCTTLETISCSELLLKINLSGNKGRVIYYSITTSGIYHALICPKLESSTSPEPPENNCCLYLLKLSC